jgi:transcriptional regulator with XRE-family HTH domain
MRARPSSIGQTIRYYRKRQHLTQEQLAAKLGVDRTSIAYYERDRHDPRLSCLLALAAALEVPVCVLLGGHPVDAPPCWGE